MYAWACLGTLLAAYTLNLGYITVFYHRGFAHRGLRLSSPMQSFVLATGNWVTGLDPKAWACMHRMHHEHSDTPLDPHSPVNVGILGVLRTQLRSYERTLSALMKGNEEYCSVVRDLDFPVNWLNRTKIWYVPYVLQLAFAVGLGLALRAPLLGICCYLGLILFFVSRGGYKVQHLSMTGEEASGGIEGPVEA